MGARLTPARMQEWSERGSIQGSALGGGSGGLALHVGRLALRLGGRLPLRGGRVRDAASHVLHTPPIQRHQLVCQQLYRLRLHPVRT